jgi:hypothetical protein
MDDYMDWNSAVQRLAVYSGATATAMMRAKSGKEQQGARQGYPERLDPALVEMNQPWSPMQSLDEVAHTHIQSGISPWSPLPYMQTDVPAWSPLPYLSSPSRATDQSSLASPASDFTQLLDLVDVTGAHSSYNLLNATSFDSATADNIKDIVTEVVASTNKRKRSLDSLHDRQTDSEVSYSALPCD